MRESLQNRLKTSDLYKINGFKTARICDFQNTQIFGILVIPSQAKTTGPGKFSAVNFKKRAFNKTSNASRTVYMYDVGKEPIVFVFITKSC